MLCTFSFLIFFVPLYEGKTTVLLICDFIKNTTKQYQHAMIFGLAGYKLIDYIKKKNAYMVLIVVVILWALWMSNSKGLLSSSFLYLYRKAFIEVIDLAHTVSITIFVAGTLSAFIIYSGLVEIVSIVLEPIMRPILKLPGNAAVDIVTSFVASSSVGVFITNQFFLEGKYTKKEAATIVSNYSVVSLGFMYYIISLTNLEGMGGGIVLLVMLLNFLLGAIMIRIPPLSLIDNECLFANDELHTRDANFYAMKRMNEALCQAEQFRISKVIETGHASINFCAGTIVQVIPIYFGVNILMQYTNIFQIENEVFGNVMAFCGLPCANEILPTIFIGIFEVSLPAIFISGMSLPIQTKFFVVVLSLVQIIFFTETANAILHSEVPVKFVQLLEIFIIRTVIAIPVLLIIINLLSIFKVW